jgi:hypothetical protein
MNHTHTIRVASWAELTDRFYAESWKESLGRFRSDYAFRGLGSSAHSLQTGLMRLGSNSAELEGHLLRNFRKYAYRDAVPFDSVWNWLALGQHHGLPTRLLDWSFSPFVALHFATANPDLFGEDGVIWYLDFMKVKEFLPARLKELLDEEGANVFTAEMLTRAAGTLREFEQLADEPFVAFFEPPSLDDRIVNQYALFSMMSDARVGLEDWLADHPGLSRQLIIPKDLKWEVRDKLDQANVTERVLFPGLDGLSRWLRRQYTPTAAPPDPDRAEPELRSEEH